MSASKVLSILVCLPKNAQLKQEALTTIGEALDLLGSLNDEDAAAQFKQNLSKSVDDVVKDVSVDANIKAKARTVRTRLAELPTMEEDTPDLS